MHPRKPFVLVLGFVDGLVLGLGFYLGVALTFLVYIDGSNLRAYMLSALWLGALFLRLTVLVRARPIVTIPFVMVFFTSVVFLAAWAGHLDELCTLFLR